MKRKTIVFIQVNEIPYPVINTCIIITGSAVVFFFGYEFYMIIMTWHSINEERVGIPSLTAKQLCTIVTGIVLIAFILMSKFIIQSLLCNRLMFSNAGTNWEKYQLYIALCEW